MTLNSIFKPDHSFLSSLNELCASSFSLQGLAFSLQDLKRSYLKASLLCARQLRYILCAKRSMGQSIRPFFPFYGQQLAISLHRKQQLNKLYIMFQHIDSFNKTNVHISWTSNEFYNKYGKVPLHILYDCMETSWEIRFCTHSHIFFLLIDSMHWKLIH